MRLGTPGRSGGHQYCKGFEKEKLGVGVGVAPALPQPLGSVRQLGPLGTVGILLGFEAG